MKVKVLKQFEDIHTKKIHPVGEEFTCTKERLAEIRKERKKLVTVIEEDAPERPAPSEKVTKKEEVKE